MGLYGDGKKSPGSTKFLEKEKKIFQAAFLTDTYIFKKIKETGCQLGAPLS